MDYNIVSIGTLIHYEKNLRYPNDEPDVEAGNQEMSKWKMLSFATIGNDDNIMSIRPTEVMLAVAAPMKISNASQLTKDVTGISESDDASSSNVSSILAVSSKKSSKKLKWQKSFPTEMVAGSPYPSISLSETAQKSDEDVQFFSSFCRMVKFMIDHFKDAVRRPGDESSIYCSALCDIYQVQN